MDGIRLCSRYSYITNCLDYCGPPGANELLKNYILTGKGKDGVEQALAKFESLYPYLESISSKHSRPPFDYGVVRAYWLGNELLDDFGREDMARVIERLAERGLPRSAADSLIRRLPEGAFPFHTFHVLFVGVGMVSGRAETTLENIDNCRVSLATVTEALKYYIVVKRAPLEIEGGKFVLGGEEEIRVRYDHNFMPKVNVGDFVSMHWGTPVQVLNWGQAKNLEIYTKRALEIVPGSQAL